MKRYRPIVLGLAAIASLFMQRPGQSAQSELILQGRCHMGFCPEMRFDRKTLLEERGSERLYEIEVTSRVTPMGEEPSRAFAEPRKHYVFCSYSQPRLISLSDAEGYVSTYLNPGGLPSGVDLEAHMLYWTTCHDIVGPDFFSDAMRQRASDLGYPLDLPLGFESGDSLEAVLPW